MNQTAISQKLPLYISLLIVGIYLLYSCYYAVNMLFSDDVHLLKTVAWMEQAPNWWEKYRIMMVQHNEHRIIVPRLLAWLIYKVQGEVNWKTMLLIGNLAWCSICWILWRIFTQMKFSYWLFLPIPLLIYQPQYTENITNYSISTLQQSGIIFLYFLIIYYVSQKRYYLPLLIACIATFTHGSGIFSFVVVILLLSYQKKWREIKAWSGVAILMVLWFFYDYTKGQNGRIEESLANPIRLVQSAMVFLGASLTAFDSGGVSVMSATIVGTLITIVAVWFLIKRWGSNQPYIIFFGGIITFIALTVALVAVSRSWQGVELIIAPRYIHYSPLIIAVTYLLLLNLYPQFHKQIAGVVGLYALVFNLLCYYKYTPQIIGRSKSLEADIYNWNKHQVLTDICYERTFLHAICPYIIEAEKVGVSKISAQHWELPTTESIDSTLYFNVEYVPHPTDLAARIGYITNDQLLDHEGFIVLRNISNGKNYLYAMIPQESAKLLFLRTFQYFKLGFKSNFLTNILLAGKYQIGIYQSGKILMSNQYITI